MSTAVYQLPAGIQEIDLPDGTKYAVNSLFQITADLKYDTFLRAAGALRITTIVERATFLKPIAAELVSVKAAAIAANGAITIAAQPSMAAKLQIRQVIVTAITAGTLTLVGFDQDNNAITEVISLVAAVSQTLNSKWAWSSITSGTVAGLVGGGDGTLGIGMGTALGLPTVQGAALGPSSLSVFKAQVDGVHEAVGTVDAVARTISPTTAANATHNYEFTYSYAQLA